MTLSVKFAAFNVQVNKVPIIASYGKNKALMSLF